MKRNHLLMKRNHLLMKRNSVQDRDTLFEEKERE
jgi:hypothetical protein